jgi:hypothetical protein
MNQTSQVVLSMNHDVKNSILEQAQTKLQKDEASFVSNILCGVEADEFIENDVGIYISIKSINWDIDGSRAIRLIYDSLFEHQKFSRYLQSNNDVLKYEVFGEFQKVKAVYVMLSFPKKKVGN